MQTGAEQGPHLVLPHPPRDGQVRGAGAHPPAGRVARRGVVVGQLLAGGAALVTGGDLPGQVGVTVSRVQLVQRHHPDRTAEHDAPKTR